MFAWNGVYTLVRVVCDMVCMIDIPNLVSLLYSAMLCMLMGREIGLWVMGIVGLVFLGLFDECILRTFFFLAFNMKHFGYFRLLRECSMYSNSILRYCGQHILSALR